MTQCTPDITRFAGGLALNSCECPRCQGKYAEKEREWQEKRRPQLEAMQKQWKASVEEMQKRVSG